MTIDIDAFAQEIRRVDGNHSLGAGALAEQLAPFIQSMIDKASNPSPCSHGVWRPRWRVFEDTTHGYWGIEEDSIDGQTILYPKAIHREAVDGVVRAHNAALSTPRSSK